MRGCDALGLVGQRLREGVFIEQVHTTADRSVLYRARDARGRPVAIHAIRVPLDREPETIRQEWEHFRVRIQTLVGFGSALDGIASPLCAASTMSPGGAFVPYLAFEWLSGETLATLLGDANPSLPQTLQQWAALFTPLARALGQVHLTPTEADQPPLAHLALAPEHLMLVPSRDGAVLRLLSFGLAEALGRVYDSPAPLTAPAYQAPEQSRHDGSMAIGPRTDVWGLASTLSRLYARRISSQTSESAPVPDSSHSLAPSPRGLGASASVAVESVFRKALALDPLQRHAHVGLFWQELEQALIEPEELSRESGQTVFGQVSGCVSGEAPLELAIEPSWRQPADGTGALAAGDPEHPPAGHERLEGDARRWVRRPVVIDLAPARSARVRYEIGRYAPAIVCAAAACAVAVGGQWFARESGQALRLGPLPLSALVILLITLSGVQVIREGGRR